MLYLVHGVVATGAQALHPGETPAPSSPPAEDPSSPATTSSPEPTSPAGPTQTPMV